jgi:3'-phosphoadenosine 5'-phosphosulfate sulfotransferase (PAPS reductase)/FAD synthetase
MVSGIEFQECIDFVVDVCRKFGWKLMFSHPEIYKGTFFDRLERFQYWPTIRKLWCQRDLKVRPQHLTLVRDFGEGSYYKLNGVRRHESTRRKFLYDNDVFIRRDTNCGGVDYEVFPILRWSDQDIINYLRIAGLPTSGLYKRFVVSGCYWCPWYQADIYYGIAKELPNLYDPMIAWESKIGPSVNGHIYLRDIKQAAMSGRPCPKSRDVRTAKNIVCAEQGCLL